MVKEELNVFDVFELLPGMNCKKCGENTCMAFAQKLVNGQKTVAGCGPLREEIYEKRRCEILELLNSETGVE